MINRICCVCSEYVSDVYTVQLSDNKERVEFSGHASCINELHNKIKSVKDLEKKKIDQVLKEIGIYKGDM